MVNVFLMKRIVCLVLLFCSFWNISSQSNFLLPKGTDSDRIGFKLINNLIVIPVEVNGAELSFLLDTGVRKPIIFSLFKETDSLIIGNAQKVFLKGLGEGTPVMALKSDRNVFKIGSAINVNQSMYAIFDENLNFSPRLGVTVHGIIGYDLFKDFIVEINYSSKFIRLNRPETYKYKKCRKCEIFDLEFHKKKPYFNIEILNNEQRIPVKLLIDSGGTDALWLFEDTDKGLNVDKAYFKDFLGHGLSGSVYGKRSRIDKIFIKNFELEGVNVAFPDSTSINQAKHVEDRNGSFSGNLLKRFNVTVDYTSRKMVLKKNKYFKDPFSYNKAGIELQQTGIRLVKERQTKVSLRDLNAYTAGEDGIKSVSRIGYSYALKPAFTIVELREGSPAKRVGLQKGDLVLSINNKSAQTLSLQELSSQFYEEENKKIRIRVERSGVPLTFVFRLEDPLNKKGLQN